MANPTAKGTDVGRMIPDAGLNQKLSSSGSKTPAALHIGLMCLLNLGWKVVHCVHWLGFASANEVSDDQRM